VDCLFFERYANLPSHPHLLLPREKKPIEFIEPLQGSPNGVPPVPQGGLPVVGQPWAFEFHPVGVKESCSALKGRNIPAQCEALGKRGQTPESPRVEGPFYTGYRLAGPSKKVWRIKGEKSAKKNTLIFALYCTISFVRGF
jgi:hypothetical protein